ncbi:lactoylglutathione lyase [Pseudomonas sessilinigenes]|uniref:Aldoketomutase n=1 Tax=Pseudomonas sessilinigenes TaxID=658629 RepID=A0ABX8MKW9_9PSED|nr:lactoylglutathione lyase [Pseudomonas sessilinigenes]AZC26631.1 Lactoylglutathione lyase [Pseudomonas sessilinigenes]QXH39377.1 lactoylglutathione lyase [Pseudomonas sessilinigenes]
MRVLHTMLRVSNLQAALDFYIRVLDMRLLRHKDYLEGRFTLAFIGYGAEQDNTVLELTHNWDQDNYNLGDAYGHVAIEVMDAAAICDRAKALGYKVLREAGHMNFGRAIIAFLQDPDGFKVELIQKGTQFD